MDQFGNQQTRRGAKKGRKRERRFFVVFSYRCYVKSHAPPWYLYIRKAKKQEDQKGCDAFMGTDMGEIGINVKSSDYGRIVFQDRQRLGERNSNIAVVPVAESFLDHGSNIRQRAFDAVAIIRERKIQERNNRKHSLSEQSAAAAA